MKLPGLPSSRDNIRARAEREGWPYEERVGQGGVRRVYELPARYLSIGASGGIPRTDIAAEDFTTQDVIRQEADPKLIEQALRAVEQWLLAKGLQMTPERKSAAVVALYDYLRVKKDIDEEDIQRFLRALSD